MLTAPPRIMAAIDLPAGSFVDKLSGAINAGPSTSAIGPALWGILSGGGVERQRGMPHAASRHFDSPSWLALQQFKQVVRRIFPLLK